MERLYLNKEIRRLVATRADYLCEYCLISEQDTILGCAIDHIISIKHGGSSEMDNLAYCCVYCNRFKGSDIGSIILDKREFSRFYHPRWDNWGTHFKLNNYVIEAFDEPIKNNESNRGGGARCDNTIGLVQELLLLLLLQLHLNYIQQNLSLI